MTQTLMALDIELKTKVGPKTYQRFVFHQRNEEVTQAELLRRAMDHYFTHLDERHMKLVSMMQAHAESAE